LSQAPDKLANEKLVAAIGACTDEKAVAVIWIV
jgi:hypothetical protein